ncbi:MAG TPA: NUDIX domain-containing protein [Chloroflexi bacterium]|nr:MAG: NUDIX hydrolase [Chloroflexota bacterium]HDN04919.1 NUDIX domain-containing protein [Chloroflexota bacterium]
MPVSDQGVSNDRYQLIPRTLIFLTRGESVLLLKGAPHKRIWAGRYNGVGGHIERGEDVHSAARRELLEETGLIPDDLWLIGTVIVDTGDDPGIGLYVMKGSCAEGQARPSEEGDLEWVAFNEILEKILVDDLPLLLPRVLKQKVSDPPFAARYSYDEREKLVVEFSD